MSNTQTRRTFLQSTAAATAAATLTQTTQAQPQTKRNIVFILIDDMRFDSMSMMGHPFLETPHLDALAAGGIHCENAFVTTSLCSPSRACFLTGQYAHRHGVLDNSTRLDPETPTFPKELQNNGYNTAFIGKWHMGGASDDPRPGFDHWISFRGQGSYTNNNYNINGESIRREGYVTDVLTEHAEDFLKDGRDKTKPFMLYLSHKAVHANFVPAERHQGSYAGEQYPYPPTMANTDENYEGQPAWVRAQRQSWHGVDGMYNQTVDFDEFTRLYCETMRAVDDSVGRVVAALKEQDLLEETLLIFTSDNGFLFGEHGHIDKRSMYEPSIRIPLIAHCPALFEGGQTRQEMMLNIDFCPTFLEAAGLDIPDTVQGQSFYKVLTGETGEWRDAFLYEYFWERSFPQTPTVLGIRTDQYKLMRFHGIWDKYAMYDIQNDPHEQHNLLADFEVENNAGTVDQVIRTQANDETKTIFNQLSQRLDQLLEETGCRIEPSWRG
jgi:N-acetylglucosamine-6-sulfatase